MFGLLRFFSHHHVETCSEVLAALSPGVKQPGCDTTDLHVVPVVKKDWNCAFTRKPGLIGGCNASYVTYSICKIQKLLLFQI
jgi:hypothetical protein